MNYRHGYHAGNFADVMKHAVLARIVVRLRDKPAPFRVIDTHAGAGLYDLKGPQASRTGEWREGIARVLAATFTAPVRDLLEPYLDAVRAYNPVGELTAYPGSPLLLQAWLRPGDRALACEKEPEAARALADNLARDNRLKALAIDGWMALPANIPPLERRGLVLIDPPYEAPDEFERLAQALIQAHRKWPTGCYLAWYPIKAGGAPQALAKALKDSGIPKILRIEMMRGRAVSPEGDDTALAGSGLIVINPPWTLEADVTQMLPALTAALTQAQGQQRLEWIATEAVARR
jgi:23S rRNA (adenine2030-N6)-methyltransferase